MKFYVVQVCTSLYKFVQVSTSLYKSLQVGTSLYKSVQVCTSLYKVCTKVPRGSKALHEFACRYIAFMQVYELACSYKSVYAVT